MKNNSPRPDRNSGSLFGQLDWFTTLVPFFCILALCAWFVTEP